MLPKPAGPDLEPNCHALNVMSSRSYSVWLSLFCFFLNPTLLLCQVTCLPTRVSLWSDCLHLLPVTSGEHIQDSLRFPLPVASLSHPGPLLKALFLPLVQSDF